jgi:hypothetical protein
VKGDGRSRKVARSACAVASLDSRRQAVAVGGGFVKREVSMSRGRAGETAGDARQVPDARDGPLLWLVGMALLAAVVLASVALLAMSSHAAETGSPSAARAPVGQGSPSAWVGGIAQAFPGWLRQNTSAVGVPLRVSLRLESNSLLGQCVSSQVRLHHQGGSLEANCKQAPHGETS